jgi:GNAT superfamily N-acetyltransferase
MTAADLPLGLRLSRQAQWNQTETDWRRFLDLGGEGCFVAEVDGTAVGTTTTCIFDSVAWIAMVLVDVEARRQGIGSALLRHALAYLDKTDIETVRLDATPAGQPVYEKLGFEAEYSLTRYEGIASHSDVECHTEEATAAMLPEVSELNRCMTGTNRATLLSRLFADAPQAMRVVRTAGRLEGFITSRPGANARQIGPCIATAQAGPILLADALNRCAGQRVFVDVPSDHVRAVQTLEAKGLKAQRHLRRMYRGKPIRDRIEALWAGSGPEKG